jgi:hypothetical protein
VIHKKKKKKKKSEHLFCRDDGHPPAHAPGSELLLEATLPNENANVGYMSHIKKK